MINGTWAVGEGGCAGLRTCAGRVLWLHQIWYMGLVGACGCTGWGIWAGGLGGHTGSGMCTGGAGLGGTCGAGGAGASGYIVWRLMVLLAPVEVEG